MVSREGAKAGECRNDDRKRKKRNEMGRESGKQETQGKENREWKGGSRVEREGRKLGREGREEVG